MVANNPLFRGKWNAKRFQATVINDIWPEVAFFTAFAAMVACVDILTAKPGGANVNMGIPSTLLTVLGTVLGLVISFRTSSAYERYQDGRKMWTNINTACRQLGQFFWLHVAVERTGANPPTQLAATIEKKTMMNILQAFPVAVKHFLRGEQGVYYEDLYPLICFLPRYANAEPHHDERLPLWHEESAAEHAREDADRDNRHEREPTEKSNSRASSRKPRKDNFDPEAALPSVNSDIPLKPARNPPETTIMDYIPLLRFFRWIIRAALKKAQPGEQRRRKKHTTIVESNAPLEIILFLSSYSAFLMRSGLLQPAIATGIMGNINTLQDTLSNLERICNTPLPFAYQAHLRMSLWLYLLFLPFQVVDSMKWITIPGTAFASFLLLGFLEIGQEIENPFNYDLNDLDLDHFCLDIQRQLHEITVHTNPNPTDFVFSPLNQPFAPADKRSAEEIMALGTEYVGPEVDARPGMSSIRRTLVKSWRNVDILTRKSY